MALHYHTAANARTLAGHLFPLLKTERQRLKPQTPQTVAIANADSEAYLTREFLRRDRILMAVNFPYLESALENLALRLIASQSPSASETWFTAPHLHASTAKFSGPLDIEVVVLALQQEKKHARLFADLGYEPQALSPTQRVLLARKLAGRLNEYLLHTPQLMHSQGSKHPLVHLWRAVASLLAQNGYFSPLHNRDELLSLIAKMQQQDFSAHGALFLFAMPLLSAYHVSLLCAIARHVDVHLLTCAVSACPAALAGYAREAEEKFAQYAALINSEAERLATPLLTGPLAVDAAKPVDLPQLSLWALPGQWRAAEILCDHWHEQMLRDASLSQEDIALAVTKPEENFPAFELAGSLRQLTVFTRQKLLQKSEPVITLLNLLAEAALNGVNRLLLMEYLDNPTVRSAFHIGPEDAALYTRTLEATHAYRDDFPGSMQTFNLAEALERLRRALVIGAEARHSVPGFAYIPEFDTPEIAAKFSAAIGFLLSAARRLKVCGPPLVEATLEIFSADLFAEEPAANMLGDLLRRVGSNCSDQSLTVSQLAAIVGEHAPDVALPQGHSSDGICISSLTGSLFVKRHQVLFNCDESMDAAQDDVADDAAEYANAVTRLSPQLQLRIHLLNSVLSGCDSLLFAYAAIDPLTGAEKYLAQEIEVLKSALSAAAATIIHQADFSQSILSAEGSDDPPLASDAEAQCAWLLSGRPPAPAGLSDLLKPALTPTQGGAAVITLAQLEKFLENPAAALLGEAGVIPEEPVDFRRDEPRLSPSEKAKLKFCDDYLRREILETETTATRISEVVRQNQRNGSTPPDSFDSANALLMINDNASRIENFAAAEKNSARLVEFHFHRDVTTPFTVMDNARLERRYLPATQVADHFITGKSAVLLQRDDSDCLTWLDSAIYPERSLALVRVHLLYCLLMVAGDKTQLPLAIEIGDYAMAKSAADQGLLEPGFHRRGIVPRDAITDPETYLAKLVTEYDARKLFWFDLKSVSKNKLAGLADAGAERIREALESDQNESRHDFLRRFYDLAPGADSVTFFDNFVRPVAAIDGENESKSTKRKKRGG